MIRVEGICKSFEYKQVLTDIDAVFEPGKVNLIIGKSGSGKTVLLKWENRTAEIDYRPAYSGLRSHIL